MTLVIQEAFPKIHDTRLKLKNPTSPQLIAPIRLTVRAVQSKALFPIDVNLLIVDIWLIPNNSMHLKMVFYTFTDKMQAAPQRYCH